jgi:hypothetical protein
LDLLWGYWIGVVWDEKDVQVVVLMSRELIFYVFYVFNILFVIECMNTLMITTNKSRNW